MKKSRQMYAIYTCLVMLLTSTTANAIGIPIVPTVFNVNRSIGGGTVTGFIVTDGKLGLLTSRNILDWSLTLSSPSLSGGSPIVIDYATAIQTTITGTAVVATQDELIFRFDVTGTNFFFLQGADGNGYCLETSGCTGAGLGEHIWRDQFTNIPAETVVHTGNVTFGRVVPIPGAVWLFGSGLLGLVGVARRKKA